MHGDVARAVDHLIEAYRSANRERLDADPDFASWMETEYVPIVGAWQY